MRRRATLAYIIGLAAGACAPGEITGAGGTGSTGRYHPEGFAAPGQHGPELKQRQLDCRTCHGEDLAGGPMAPSCDTCHTPADPPAWRKQCTFCHGGVNDTTGAPPRNLDGTMEANAGVFPPHEAHVGSTLSAPLDCVQCHVKAIDVLSPGHIFDDTMGHAETDFGAGLSPQGTWDGAGSCANLYCHGSGRGDDGVTTMADGAMACASCHPSLEAGATAWNTMSGLHGLHLGAMGVTCAECHAPVTTSGVAIDDPALHVNGARDVGFLATGFVFDAPTQTCTGSCHGVTHAGYGWTGTGGSVHPPGYAEPGQHGPDMVLQRMDCRGCHGDTLAGGPGAPSCDTCHTPAWRSTCTYCHGGGVDLTGAPPRDLGALPSTVSASFVAHPKHVNTGVSVASDCTECHRKPVDVMSLDHAFDSTAGAAELTFAAGRSPAGTYDGAGGCANLYCHGNGRGDNGAITDAAAPPGCGGCHAGLASGETAWGTMSGEHRKHLQEGMDCGECHAAVTGDGVTILDPALHVDRSRQVAFAVAGVTYTVDTKRCTGACHGENHQNEAW